MARKQPRSQRLLPFVFKWQYSSDETNITWNTQNTKHIVCLADVSPSWCIMRVECVVPSWGSRHRWPLLIPPRLYEVHYIVLCKPCGGYTLMTYLQWWENPFPKMENEGHILKVWCVLKLCLHEENCRGGTEMSVKITCDVEDKRTCWEKRLFGLIVETKKRGEEENNRVITMGVTMSWPSKENAHTMARLTLQMLCGLTAPPMVRFPDTCGGKLVALHQYHLPDKVIWTYVSPNCK